MFKVYIYLSLKEMKVKVRTSLYGATEDLEGNFRVDRKDPIYTSRFGSKRVLNTSNEFLRGGL